MGNLIGALVGIAWETAKFVASVLLHGAGVVGSGGT